MVKVKKKYLPLATLMPLVVVIDQLTKSIVIDKFRLFDSKPLIDGFFSLTYVRNTGAAFGMMATADPAFRIPFFLTVPLLALGIIGYLFKKLPDSDLKMSTTLSLIISGAIGNLIDRARFGYVIDFLDFYWKDWHYPAFNVADMAICVGVGFMSAYMLFQKEPVESEPSELKKASKKGI